MRQVHLHMRVMVSHKLQMHFDESLRDTGYVHVDYNLDIMLNQSIHELQLANVQDGHVAAPRAAAPRAPAATAAG